MTASAIQGLVSSVLVALLVFAPSGARAQGAPPVDDGKATPGVPAAKDAMDGEFPLPAGAGWHASLVLDNGTTGIWTVKQLPVWTAQACPPVVGLDDKGVCHVMVPYSGRWTPYRTIADGKWLGGLDCGDVDPRLPGTEIYAGSQSGNVYQGVAHRTFFLDNRLIAYLPGREVHTIVAGDLDPATAGAELLVFTRPGGLYRITPDGPNGTFRTTLVQDIAGRVRDAVVLPARPGQAAEIATVMDAGRLDLLRMTADGPRWENVLSLPMGLGRLAVKPGSTEAGTVLYATVDDGRVFRLERSSGPGWAAEVIYHGPLGPRGIAAGPFHENPALETLAVYGYAGKVEILTRTEAGWTAEVAFQDRDKGHWLCAAEVDGRNGTREILASGYGGRIVLLSRPPGYGERGAATTR